MASCDPIVYTECSAFTTSYAVVPNSINTPQLHTFLPRQVRSNRSRTHGRVTGSKLNWVAVRNMAKTGGVHQMHESMSAHVAKSPFPRAVSGVRAGSQWSSLATFFKRDYTSLDELYIGNPELYARLGVRPNTSKATSWEFGSLRCKVSEQWGAKSNGELKSAEWKTSNTPIGSDTMAVCASFSFIPKPT